MDKCLNCNCDLDPEEMLQEDQDEAYCFSCWQNLKEGEDLSNDPSVMLG